MRTGTRRSSDRGASLVEAALVLPVVVLLLMGVVDFGRVFFSEINLNNAVSEGALFAAQFPDDHTKTVQRVLDAGADLGLQSDDVTVVCVPPAGGPEKIRVEAELDVDMLTPIGQWFGDPVTLTSESTAVNTRSLACDPTP